MARRLHWVLQPPLAHHDTQYSCPAGLVGGRWSRNSSPSRGRSWRERNCWSGVGFASRCCGGRADGAVPPVTDDTAEALVPAVEMPDRVATDEVGTAVDGKVTTVEPPVGGLEKRLVYDGGNGSQQRVVGKFPRPRSSNSSSKVGAESTASKPAFAEAMRWKYSIARTCMWRKTRVG